MQLENEPEEAGVVDLEVVLLSANIENISDEVLDLLAWLGEEH